MSKKKILIIEDDSDLNASLRVLLRGAGYEVIGALNGNSGITKVKKNKPDLVICDIMMPGISGYDVFNELSSDSKTRTIPFIFLTAKVKYDDIRYGMTLGADDYIIKPFEADDLLNAVKIRITKHENSLSDSDLKEKADDAGKNDRRFDYSEKIAITMNGKSIFVSLQKIMHISMMDHYSSLLLDSGKSVIVRSSMSNWENILPENKFVRVHRSVIVNIDYIKKLERNPNSTMKLFLANKNEPISISRRYASKMRRLFVLKSM